MTTATAASGNQYRAASRGNMTDRGWRVRFDDLHGHVRFQVCGSGFSEYARLGWAWEHGPLLERADAILHPLERQYFDSVPSDRRRRTFLLGRCAAKRAIAADVPDTSVAVVSGSMGQPVIQDGGGTEISISHDDHLACAVVAPTTTPVAVDLERAEPKRAEVMLTQMSRRECGVGERLGAERKFWVTAFWTAKEALAKLLRCGLGCRLEVLEVAAMEVGEAGFDGRFRNFPQYRFVGCMPLPGYIVTLASPRALAVDAVDGAIDAPQPFAPATRSGSTRHVAPGTGGGDDHSSAPRRTAQC